MWLVQPFLGIKEIDLRTDIVLWGSELEESAGEINRIQGYEVGELSKYLILLCSLFQYDTN
jgi:hypothetical protein